MIDHNIYGSVSIGLMNLIYAAVGRANLKKLRL
ncbi:hypothetical protein Brsp05_03487 [Brucella sp. NBRC 12953]